MSQLVIPVNDSSYIIPRKISYHYVANSEMSTTIELVFANDAPMMSINHDFILRKPSKAHPDALKLFKPKLPEILPILKNLTDEELEKILDEKDRDDLDD